MIDLFKEKYAFLSNFYLGEILYKGVIFPTLENVYQAAKYDGEDAATVYQEFAQITPGKAKRKDSKLSCRTDWDKIKLQVMEKLLRLKFAQPYFKELLLATGEQELIEGNYWHDNFWGSCFCEKCGNRGQNHLGKLLIILRSEYKSTDIGIKADEKI